MTASIFLAYRRRCHATCQAPEDTHYRDTRATQYRLAVLNRWINRNTVMHHVCLYRIAINAGLLSVMFPIVAACLPM